MRTRTFQLPLYFATNAQREADDSMPTVDTVPSGCVNSTWAALWALPSGWFGVQLTMFVVLSWRG